MKRKLTIFGLWVSLLFVLGFIFSTLILSAQTIPPPHPDGPDTHLSTEEYQAMMAPGMTQEAIIRGRDLRDYKIAYLVDEASREGAIFSEQDIVQYTYAQVFYNWEEFEAVNKESPFEIVILHKSSLDFIDPDWAAAAYRNDIIFFGLNVLMPDFGELFNAPCMLKGDERVNIVTANWLISPAYGMRDRSAPNRDVMVEALLQDCIKKDVSFTGPWMRLNLDFATAGQNLAHIFPALIDAYGIYVDKEANNE